MFSVDIPKPLRVAASLLRNGLNPAHAMTTEDLQALADMKVDEIAKALDLEPEVAEGLQRRLGEPMAIEAKHVEGKQIERMMDVARKERAAADVASAATCTGTATTAAAATPAASAAPATET